MQPGLADRLAAIGLVDKFVVVELIGTIAAAVGLAGKFAAAGKLATNSSQPLELAELVADRLFECS